MSLNPLSTRDFANLGKGSRNYFCARQWCQGHAACSFFARNARKESKAPESAEEWFRILVLLCSFIGYLEVAITTIISDGLYWLTDRHVLPTYYGGADDGCAGSAGAGRAAVALCRLERLPLVAKRLATFIVQWIGRWPPLQISEDDLWSFCSNLRSSSAEHFFYKKRKKNS